jgi:ferric-dicitrate binding protein FerR (iron transport regulator)
MENNKDNILQKILVLKALEADIQENKSINKTEAYRKTRWKIEKVSWRKSMLHFLNRAAAILILPLLISTVILSYLLLTEKKEDSPVSVAFTEVTALPGMVVKTQLPDSSKIWLNSGSTLRYPIRFSSEKRAVNLTGEAFFEVRSNPKYPFEVKTSDGVAIMARGTSFNVNAYPEDRVTETVLQEGMIDIYYKGRHISVTPDEMISIDKTSELFKRSGINIQEKTGWKDGMLIFRNTPLDEVFKKISRRYNVEIVLHRETNEVYRVHATFSSETLPQILDILKIAAPIQWSIKELHHNSDSTYSRQKIDVRIK